MVVSLFLATLMILLSSVTKNIQWLWWTKPKNFLKKFGRSLLHVSGGTEFHQTRGRRLQRQTTTDTTGSGVGSLMSRRNTRRKTTGVNVIHSVSSKKDI